MEIIVIFRKMELAIQQLLTLVTSVREIKQQREESEKVNENIMNMWR